LAGPSTSAPQQDGGQPTVDGLRIREAEPTGHDVTVKIRVQCIGPDGKLEIQQYQLLLADFISAKSPFRNRSRTPGEASGLRLRQARSNARPRDGGESVEKPTVLCLVATRRRSLV
jgi:hypothetical protein